MPVPSAQVPVPTRLMLVDDHLILRQVLELALGAEPDLRVVATCADAESALTALATLVPDVVLMDLGLPGMDGIAATREVVQQHPLVRVLVLTGTCTRGLVAAALDAGAWGYVLKDDPLDDLLSSIREVGAGRPALAAAARTLLRT